MRVLIVNGPNLNILGSREPELYGTYTWPGIMARLRENSPELSLHEFQSNHEGALIDRLQAADEEDYLGIVLNPGALAHTSHALADCLRSLKTPVVEVHLTNVHARESWRHALVTGAACRGVISGLGPMGYGLALRWLYHHIGGK